ncbi:MAG: TonB-dependent receptor [Candidatus Krumholzibacteria bacterium]|nr:TonB-dependent receptor [Candidatus Krumholzibacteria bacterium]
MADGGGGMKRGMLVIALLLLAPQCLVSAGLSGTVAGDSLLMPTESFVLTREDLMERNIHTLDDILQLIPGVAVWREGPHDAYGGFSIEGRGDRGINLLVNGVPAIDCYTSESLTRFLPLSRLQCVEVVYSGSPCFSGDLSSRGFINVVLEEGGREAPASQIDFTYGTSNRRVRRAWFSTPRAAVSAALAYDEYLQDGVEAYPAIAHKLLGKCDGRSVLAELAMQSSAGDDVLLRFQRYEDSYYGTLHSDDEDVRRSGFGSEISYARSGFSGSVTQRVLEMSRLAGTLDERISGALVRWNGAFHGIGVRTFANAEQAAFENDLWEVNFNPSYRRIEAGITLGGTVPQRVTWRLGAYGGNHSTVGRYGCGEIALAKEWSARLSQDIVIARRLRVPSAQELFQPELARSIDGEAAAIAGNSSLSPEIADELSLGFRCSGASLSLFGRDERSLVVVSGDDPAVYRSDGSGRVAGVRTGFAGSRRILGIDLGLSLGFEGYPERGALARGVPSYRGTGELSMRCPIFAKSETLSIKLDSELAGERRWDDSTLGAYHVLGAAAYLTIMSARVSFEYKNILDERYETVPGYTMPPRHYIIGIFWELLD